MNDLEYRYASILKMKRVEEKNKIDTGRGGHQGTESDIFVKPQTEHFSYPSTNLLLIRKKKT